MPRSLLRLPSPHVGEEDAGFLRGWPPTGFLPGLWIQESSWKGLFGPCFLSSWSSFFMHCGWILYHLSHQGSPIMHEDTVKIDFIQKPNSTGCYYLFFYGSQARCCFLFGNSDNPCSLPARETVSYNIIPMILPLCNINRVSRGCIHAHEGNI